MASDNVATALTSCFEPLQRLLEAVDGWSTVLAQNHRVQDTNLAAFIDNVQLIQTRLDNIQDMETRLQDKDSALEANTRLLQDKVLEISRIKQEVLGAREAIASLEARLQEQEQNTDVLLQEKENALEEQEQASTALLQDKDREISRIRQEVLGAREAIASLEARLQEQEQNTNVLLQEKEAALQDQAHASTLLQDKDVELSTRRQELSDKHRIIETLEARIREQEQRFGTAMQENESAVRELNISLQGKDHELSQKQEQLNLGQLEVTHNLEVITTLQTQLSEQEALLREKDNELSRRNEWLYDRRKQMKKLKAQELRKEQETSALLHDKDEELRQKTDEVSDQNQMITALKVQLQRRNDEISRKKQMAETLKVMFSRDEEELSRTKEQLSQQSQTIEQLRAEFSKANDQVFQNETILGTLHNTIAGKDAALLRVSVERTSLQAQLQESRRDLAKVRDDYDELQTDFVHEQREHKAILQQQQVVLEERAANIARLEDSMKENAALGRDTLQEHATVMKEHVAASASSQEHAGTIPQMPVVLGDSPPQLTESESFGDGGFSRKRGRSASLDLSSDGEYRPRKRRRQPEYEIYESIEDESSYEGARSSSDEIEPGIPPAIPASGDEISTQDDANSALSDTGSDHGSQDPAERKAQKLRSLFLLAWDYTDDEETAILSYFASLFSRGKVFKSAVEIVDQYCMGRLKEDLPFPRSCMMAKLISHVQGKDVLTMTQATCPLCSKRKQICLWAKHAPGVATGFGQRIRGVITAANNGRIYDPQRKPRTVELGGHRVRWILKKRRATENDPADVPFEVDGTIV